MKFFILALMSVMYTDPSTNLSYEQYFVFHTPHFYSVNDCKEFARENTDILYYKIFEEYGVSNPPKLISCVDESVIKIILNEQKERLST